MYGGDDTEGHRKKLDKLPAPELEMIKKFNLFYNTMVG